VQPIWLETFAHRHTKAPVDTLLRIYDSDGKLLQESDEGVADAGYEQWYDFRTPDTRLTFTPKMSGIYYVNVTDANRSFGPRVVYRLQCKLAEPDFEMIQLPDAVPVWGPGSTASFLLKIERQSSLDADIELSVEGLPAGWSGSRHVNTWKSPQNTSNYSTKQFLTITAPRDVAPGTVSEFRVVGRAKVGERLIERTALPLSLYYTSDTGLFRITPIARVAVARPQGPTLAALTADVTMKMNETAQIPVQIIDADGLKELSLNANVCSNVVAANWGSPQSLSIQDGKVLFPLQVPEGVTPGNYSLVIARSWRADIRVGMPGPCTSIIKLTILPKQ
jgi:hypothetical protein